VHSSSEKKIMPLDQLVEHVSRYRDRPERTVLCHGCFDLLHIGHIRHFEQAHRWGEILIVTVTADQYVDKGPERPMFPEAMRAKAVASLDCVDFVAINPWPTAENTIRQLQPSFFVKGGEFRGEGADPTGKISSEARVASEVGTEVVFTDDDVVFSSSNLLNQYLFPHSKAVKTYLEEAVEDGLSPDFRRLLDELPSLRVLVMGDIILDEYQYCDALGVANKNPALTVALKDRVRFAGGAAAVANTVAGFVDRVDLVGVLGGRQDDERFVTNGLRPEISPHLVVNPSGRSMVKTRFIDKSTSAWLLEAYLTEKVALPDALDRDLCRWLEAEIATFDVILVADYGHGAISRNLVSILVEKAPYLVVNTQSNAGNRGIHTIGRYPRADFVCLNEKELLLHARDRHNHFEEAMLDVSRDLSCQLVAVTRGSRGCALLPEERPLVRTPSLAGRIVDPIGAGDAFLSIAALAAARGARPELVGLVGNAAAALAVGYPGHDESVDRHSLSAFVTSLLK